MSSTHHTFEMTGVPPSAFAPNRMLTGIPLELRSNASDIAVGSSSVSARSSAIKHISLSLPPGFVPAQIQRIVSLTLEIKNEDGKRTKLSNLPFGIISPSPSHIVLESERQSTPWHFKLQVDSSRKEIKVGFNLVYAGLSVREALEGARFYAALSIGGELVVLGTNTITGGAKPLARASIPPKTYESNARLVKTLERLEFIQDRTGVSFSIPERAITVEEANTIAATTHILKTGHATYKAEPWISLSKVDQAQIALDSFQGEKLQPMALHFDEQMVVIFGQPIELGSVTLFCAQSYIRTDDLARLKEEIEDCNGDATISIPFTPVEECPVEARYLKWVSEDEAAALMKMPMYQNATASIEDGLSFDPINVDFAVNLLESWYEEDPEEQRKTWENLKKALDEDRLSDRKLFP